MHSARSNYLHSEATIGDDGEESSLTDTDDSEDDLDLVPDGENENEDNNELENFPCIRVAARIRPPTTDEEQGAEDCLHISEESKTVTVSVHCLVTLFPCMYCSKYNLLSVCNVVSSWGMYIATGTKFKSGAT